MGYAVVSLIICVLSFSNAGSGALGVVIAALSLINVLMLSAGIILSKTETEG